MFLCPAARRGQGRGSVTEGHACGMDEEDVHMLKPRHKPRHTHPKLVSLPAHTPTIPLQRLVCSHPEDEHRKRTRIQPLRNGRQCKGPSSGCIEQGRAWPPPAPQARVWCLSGRSGCACAHPHSCHGACRGQNQAQRAEFGLRNKTKHTDVESGCMHAGWCVLEQYALLHALPPQQFTRT